MVLGSHAFVSNTASSDFVIRTIGQILFYGQFGVDLFFVLSGFLITGILLDTREDPQFFRNFYARRFLRISPLYYGVLFVLFALTPFLHLHWQGLAVPLLLYIQNLYPTRLDTFYLAPSIGLYHFWSLAIEEQFYLVWPAVVFFLRPRRTLFYLTLALSAASLILRIVLLGAGAGNVMVHINTLCRADSLLIGGALALLYRSPHWPRVLRLAPTTFLVCFFAVLASILLGHGPLITWFDQAVRYTVLAIGFAGLIACSLPQGSPASRIFSLPTLRFFGKYSYGLYVLHVFVLTLLLLPLRTHLLALTHSKGLAVALAGCIALGLSVLAAVLSFRIFESPILRLKRFFTCDPVPAAEARLPVYARSA